MTQAAKKKASSRRFPIYGCVARAGDVPRNALVIIPLTKWDGREVEKYGAGAELRLDPKEWRNSKFHRLAHALGALAVEQIPGFEMLKSHDALKRLQRECGVQCDEITAQIDLGEFGKHDVPIRQPRSIAFDSLDEAEFQELVAAIYKHISVAYWPSMTEDAIAEMVEMYERDH